MSTTTKYRDLGYKKLMGNLGKLRGSRVDIGIFGGTSPSGKSVLVYAVTNEFGTRDGRIPSRSFMRSTVDENKHTYKAAVDRGLSEIGFGTTTPKRALTVLGIQIQNDIKKKIRTLQTPDNAESTKLRKNKGGRRKKPLIDSGTMLKSVKYRTRGV